MQKSIEINRVYQLAGLQFDSPWKCLTVSANSMSEDMFAIMKNVNTGELRQCTRPEITEDGKIQWARSSEIGDWFTIKTYQMTGKNKQSFTKLPWFQILQIWKMECRNHYPAPTIWFGGARLVDGWKLFEEDKGIE